MHWNKALHRKKPIQIRNHEKTQRRMTVVQDARELCKIMQTHGTRTAFTYFVGRETQDMTYAAFAEMVHQAAAGLDKAGLAGKRVAVIGETAPEWVCIYLAVLVTGGVIVPLDKELPVAEIGNFLTRAKAAALACSHSFLKKLGEIAAGAETLETVIPFHALTPAASESSAETDASAEAASEAAAPKWQEIPSLPQGCSVLPLPDLCALGAENPDYTYPEPDRERLAELLFTSGTTGTSKCVMLCQRNIFSVVTAAASTVDFYPEDVVVSVLPLHHTYELAVTLAELDYGIHVCINDSLRHVLRNIERFRPTALVLVPLIVQTIYRKIWAEAAKKKKTKELKAALFLSRALLRVGIDKRATLFKDVRDAFGGRLNKIICGGAALRPELITAFEDFGISVYEGYGITECAPLTCVTPYYKRKVGSVGPSVPCCTARIDATDRNDCGYPEGEIQFRGENVMLGYCDDPEANANAFTEDGWYRTGDVGYMDEDGYVYITGRLKSVIVLESGKNVFPEEVEEYLEKISSIAESVVLGRKNEEDHVVLTAVLYPNYAAFPAGTPQAEVEDAIRKEILALNKKMPSFKQIQQVEFRVTEFEKTTTKKIKRHLVV